MTAVPPPPPPFPPSCPHRVRLLTRLIAGTVAHGLALFDRLLAGNFYLTLLVVKLQKYTQADFLTSPSFIVAGFTHFERTAETYRLGFALLRSFEPRLKKASA